jgi:uncharacterized membrane protein YedE/YeeE
MNLATFNWMSSLFGGVLIGGSAVLLMAFKGRIAGVSGIVGGLPASKPNDRAWRVLFVLGLIVGVGAAVGFGWAESPSAAAGSTPKVVLAAVLVGVGTALANGCTSGHGVCGLSRGSARSMVATLTFMATGALVVYVLRHVISK